LDLLADKPDMSWTLDLLAGRLGVDVRAVKRAVRRLQALGFISTDSQFPSVGTVVMLNRDAEVVKALLAFRERIAALPQQ
jgi:DNA-binding IclR family transcriptional regulator